MAINRKSTEAASTRRLCVGSLAAHIDKFAESLAGEGYVSQTAKAKCALVADLSHWLKQRGVSLAQLDEARLKQFHTHRRGSRRRAMYLPVISCWSICVASESFLRCCKKSTGALRGSSHATTKAS
jgi:hypothetical protein